MRFPSDDACMANSNPTVDIVHEEKIYPEEDFEYEGTVNGKKWSATYSTGMGATIWLETPDGVELSDEEEQAVYDTIWNR